MSFDDFLVFRVIAVGEGQGELLTVSLELADKCHNKVQPPLAIASHFIAVKTAAPRPADRGGKKEKRRGGRNKERKSKNNPNNNGGNSIKSVDMGGISEILSNIALRDDNSRGREVDVPFHGRGGDSFVDTTYAHEATTLEVGMYILLGVFCLAITVFMASCFVYASKHNQPRFQVSWVCSQFFFFLISTQLYSYSAIISAIYIFPS